MTPDFGVDRIDEAIRVADAYIETRNYQRAREVLRSSLTQHPDDPILLSQYARTEYLLNNYASAAQSAHAALAVSPLDEFAMRMYALSLDGLGRSEDARFIAYQAVLAHPNEPRVHRLYARLLHSARQLASALEVTDKALELDANNADALILRGLILHDMGRISESDEAYRQALALEPGNAEALNNMAVNRLRSGNFGNAMRGFLGAAGSDPALGDLARRNIGAVLVKMMRRVTPAALFLGLLVAVAGSADGRSYPSIALRVMTGLMTVLLVGLVGWLIRSMPRRVLVSVLREHDFISARIVHALLAVALGIWATAFGASAYTLAAGVVVLTAGLLIARVGLSVGK